ncbi:MAG TPA: dihydroneopterin aldolase [Flavobacterium sp.]|nr:dihydroneopterin aldolase [Flavobacterium sp.]
MGIIRLKNIRVFANHGCLVEEKKIGSDYRVDLEIKADLRKSATTDELADTVDYVHLNRIVVEEMAVRSKLLEHVARRIILRIFEELPMVSKVLLEVSKINPPIGGDVEQVTIAMEEYRA